MVFLYQKPDDEVQKEWDQLATYICTANLKSHSELTAIVEQAFNSTKKRSNKRNF